MESPAVYFVSSLRDEASPEDLDAAISRISPDEYRQATAFAFRIPLATIEQVASRSCDLTRKIILRRLKGKRVYLFTYLSIEKVHRVVYLTRLGVSTPRQQRTLLAAIRGAELGHIIDASRDICFLRATNTFHFLTPSHLHCSLFLRVSDAIRSLETLDKLAFWLLPHIARADAFLTDGWGMASVIIRAMHILKRDIPFDCLGEYPVRPSSSAEQTIAQLLHEGKSPCRLGFLVSLTITGELIHAVRQAVERGGLGGVTLDAQALYSFSNSICPVEPMCKLSEELKFYSSVENCDLCRDGSKLMPLDPRLNLVRLGKEEQVVLRAEHLPDGREFLERYRHVIGLLRVHRDDPNDGRHHAFDVDVLTLLKEPVFIKRYEQKLSELPKKPNVVVTPDHEPGRIMAEIASNVLGQVPVVVHNDLRQGPSFPRRYANQLKNADNLLIVDDVLNSGSRLTTYNRSLRDAFPHLKSIVFVVGVARPESLKEWNTHVSALERYHGWSASLRYIERIYLPRWNSTRCPWCQEFEFLSDIGGLIATPPSWLNERLKSLSERRSGISDAPLLLLNGVATRNLGSQSPVGPEGCTPMHALFSLTSGVQCLRNDPDEEKKLALGFPVSNVFAARNLSNYSDGLLRACLLRLVLPSEWGFTQIGEIEQKLREELANVDGEIMLGEVLLAMSRNSFPPFSRQSFEQIYSKWLGLQLASFATALGAR